MSVMALFEIIKAKLAAIIIAFGLLSMPLGGVDTNKVYRKEFVVGGEKVLVGIPQKTGLFGGDKFIPEVKLEKWGDETSIRVWSEEEGDVSATQVGDKIVWNNKDGSKEYNFYALPSNEKMENGGFEYEIILKEKPAVNVIELKIESENLVFYYQPPLYEQKLSKRTTV